MKLVYWLKELDVNSESVVGSVGALLGELHNNNYPVNSGFVVPPHVFKEFLKHNGLLDKVNSLGDVDFDRVVDVSDFFVNSILGGEFPPSVADRILSYYHNLSGGVSGLSDSAYMFIGAIREKNPVVTVFLAHDSLSVEFFDHCVKGDSEVLSSVKKCWAKVFSPDNLVFLKLSNKSVLDSAVIVQRFVEADHSGVAYTHNPLGDGVLVEAVHGLINPLIMGQVSPDCYVVSGDSVIVKRIGKQLFKLGKDYRSGRVVSKPVDGDQVLSERSIQKISGFVKRISSSLNGFFKLFFTVQSGRLSIVSIKRVNRGSGIERVGGVSGGEVLVSGEPLSTGVVRGVVGDDIVVLDFCDSKVLRTVNKVSGVIVFNGGFSCVLSEAFRFLGKPLILVNDGQGLSGEVILNGFIGEVLRVVESNSSQVFNKGSGIVVSIKVPLSEEGKKFLKELLDLSNRFGAEINYGDESSGEGGDNSEKSIGFSLFDDDY